MDNSNLDNNTVGKENIEHEELCCFLLLAIKKTESKSHANHIGKSKVQPVAFLKNNIMAGSTKESKVL